MLRAGYSLRAYFSALVSEVSRTTPQPERKDVSPTHLATGAIASSAKRCDPSGGHRFRMIEKLYPATGSTAPAVVTPETVNV